MPPTSDDIRADRGETNNLASVWPDKRNELLARLRAWKQDIGA